MKQLFFITGTLVLFASCQLGNHKPDASGVFESDEVIVSAEQPGKILSLNVHEGDVLQKGMNVGQIDISNFQYQKEQVQSTISILPNKTSNPHPQLQLIKDQLAVQETNLKYLQGERERIARLLKADAATKKQYDDMNAKVEELQKQIVVTRQQIAVYTSNVSTQNRAILSEKNPMEKSVKLIENQISKGSIINPVNGTVLTKYAMEGEMAGAGRALYKIANLDTLNLRAYITGSQLNAVKLGQNITVQIDNGEKGYKSYPGTITWISDRSEFTPKTIQTKDERANLVYAIKIRVKNDGYIKLGMYGEVKF
ncbi:MAG: HlyD family efflux transporter periplasmic adaptor subunit [Sphingobacteriales bacterium]|jgi:HlyD family secretion protein|nr:HlyD family efflux transporter periplasmic adaptor subunit [Sphingobacteriales bacterium]